MFEYVENLRKVYNVLDGEKERATAVQNKTLSEFYCALPGLLKIINDGMPLLVMAFDKKNNEIACYYVLAPRPKDLILFAVIDYTTAITEHKYAADGVMDSRDYASVVDGVVKTGKRLACTNGARKQK